MATLTFDDIDWEGREVIVRASRAKNGRERRIPIDDGLWDILGQQEATRADRQPNNRAAPRYDEQIQAKFSRDHVFVSTANTLMTSKCVYSALMRCCNRAGIDTKVVDGDGKVLTHVDVHSLRKTFATELIEGGADPKSVQTLLGHQTLEITMKLYTKLRRGTKRQAVGRLSYGAGASAPEHLLEFPNRHKTVTTGPESQAPTAQAVAE